MAFEELSEQPQVARVLRAALRSDRMPHACMFLGAEGIGRCRAARELARVVLCLGDRPADDACGACESCRRMAAGTHPDYCEVGVPDGKQLLPIESVRHVQHLANLKPRLSARRFFVIREADRLTQEAANCFLKTLEEPPGGCVFVLVASTLHDIPQTIVSRCQLVRFRNTSPEALAERLRREGLEEAEALWLARRTRGSPGAARRFAEMGLRQFSEELQERMGRLSLRDNFELSDWLNSMAGEGAGSASEARKALQDLLDCLVVYYCDRALSAGDGDPDADLDRADLVLETIERVGANANRTLALDHLFTELGRRQKTRT